MGLLTEEELEDNKELIARITDTLIKAEKANNRIGNRNVSHQLTNLHSALAEAAEVLGINIADPEGPVIQSGGTPKRD